MARTPTLYDHRGNPVNVSTLKREVAAPAVGDVVSVWTETIVSGLTPIAMAHVLNDAARGYPDRFFALAQEMEERDLHYASVLGTRKRALTGVEPIVAAASKDAKDQKIADAVKDLVSQPEFVDDYVTDALDALAKGYSVIELIWDRTPREWWLAGYKWRDQRLFVIDKVDGTTLRRKEPGNADGIPLEPYKFSIHKPKLKSGLPIRGGLARLAAWAFLFKSYTLKDWMAFIEVYGMPLRVGKFGRGASHDDRRVLLQAVRDISTDAAAIIPKEMEIEFVEAAGSAGNAVFSAKAEYLDKQISKGVLGQTMSSDDGSSLSQAKIHENVRHDIARADARQFAATANRDVIRPFVDLNFGPQEFYPTVVWPISEAEDIKALVEAVRALVPLGMEVSMPDVRRRIGFNEPERGETTLQARVPGATLTDSTATARRSERCGHCGEVHALAAQSGQDEIEQLAEIALADWQKDMAPIVDPIQRLFNEAKSYDELLSGLDDLMAKLDEGPLADRLAKLMMKVRALGDTGDGRT